MTKKTLFLLLATLVGTTLTAAPVDRNTARQAATNHLRMLHLIDSNEMLSWTDTYSDAEGHDCFYIFNIGCRGFVLVGADDRCTPILGFSSNGIWRHHDLPNNLAHLLECYRTSISAGIKADIAPIEEHLNEWRALIANDASYYTRRDSKSIGPLMSTTWGQGYGCDAYTPEYEGEHVVVGCVALAMAQIMHYHGYPTHGFGEHAYTAEYYGRLSADFYNSTYDHSRMPNYPPYGTAQEIDATSLFCYHCGIAVNMRYENPNHTSGSGAYTSDVPDGLRHFGYFHAKILPPTSGTDQGWHDVMRPQLDAHLPLYVSGNGDGGGHAFVCDGYSAAYNLYHFNYGWSGWGDGNYTLQSMQYGESLTVVGDIYPSHVESHSSPLHMACDAPADGDGSSWAHPAGNFADVMTAASMTGAPVWMKAGTYYGDTTGSYAFVVPKGIKLYGGFAGTEDSLAQRIVGPHPTLLDGGNRRGVMTCLNNNSDVSDPGNTLVSAFTLTHGHKDDLAALDLVSGSTAEWMTIKGNRAVSGTIVGVFGGILQLSQIYGNESDHQMVTVTDGKIKNNLIAQNRCRITLYMNDKALIVQNTIVDNGGWALHSLSTEGTIAGNILWDNDSALMVPATSPRVIYCRIQSDTTANPLFIAPADSAQRGMDAVLGDYRLQENSPCIDQGDKSKGYQTRMDLDGNNRFINGRADQGCYESDYPVGILAAETDQIAVYPNPVRDLLHVDCSGIPNSVPIAVYDATGRLVAHSTTQDQSAVTIDLRHLTPGLYLLKIGSNVRRFVKD